MIQPPRKVLQVSTSMVEWTPGRDIITTLDQRELGVNMNSDKNERRY